MPPDPEDPLDQEPTELTEPPELELEMRDTGEEMPEERREPEMTSSPGSLVLDVEVNSFEMLGRHWFEICTDCLFCFDRV